MKAIITVIGEDKVGIIAKVSSLLASTNVNILDISQTVLQDYFTMMMLVDISELNIPQDKLNEELDRVGKELDLSIKLQHEDIFRSMHRI